MENLSQNQPLIKETASLFRTAEGKKKLLEALEKVSQEVEIQPPITLDKLMSVFGTTALMLQPNFPINKILKVGRITNETEREVWINSLKNLDKLYNNQQLEQEIQEQFYEINSLESFAEELAIRTKVLFMELENALEILPNQLKIGEQLTEQLDVLSAILEIDNNRTHIPTIQTSTVTQEKQRASNIATESLLKKEFLPVSSSASYQAMREVVALKKFSRDVESPYPTAFVEKPSIKGKIQLTPVKTDAVYGEKLKELEASMWEKREQLSDLHVDVIDAMCATWIVQSSSDESKAIVTADDMLKIRGLKPILSGSGRRGGYTMKQREEISQAVQDLENIWFEITENVKRGKKVKTNFIQSRAIVITDRGGQTQIDGTLDVMWFAFRPGSIFARYLLNEGRQTALLAAQALRYNVRTEAVEKRLARYLSWQWRIRSKSASYLSPYEVQVLVKESGINIPERNANRACERLEKALDRLQSDKIISSWQYLDWNWENSNKHGWIKNWLKAKIAVEPPSLVQDSYQSISQSIEKQRLTESSTPIKNKNIFHEEVKFKRKFMKLSQMQLAEIIGVSQPTISRLESGKSIENDEIEKIKHWLNS